MAAREFNVETHWSADLSPKVKLPKMDILLRFVTLLLSLLFLLNNNYQINANSATHKLTKRLDADICAGWTSSLTLIMLIFDADTLCVWCYISLFRSLRHPLIHHHSHRRIARDGSEVHQRWRCVIGRRMHEIVLWVGRLRCFRVRREGKYYFSRWANSSFSAGHCQWVRLMSTSFFLLETVWLSSSADYNFF